MTFSPDLERRLCVIAAAHGLADDDMLRAARDIALALEQQKTPAAELESKLLFSVRAIASHRRQRLRTPRGAPLA